MAVAIVWGALVVVLIGFMFTLPFYLHRHPERRSPSGSKASGMLGIGDELFHPDAYAARLVLDEQQRIVEPAPTPDGDKGISADGRIRIDLTRS
jgi:hypothetical protein